MIAINQLIVGIYICPIKRLDVWITVTLGKQSSTNAMFITENVAKIIDRLAIIAAKIDSINIGQKRVTGELRKENGNSSFNKNLSRIAHIPCVSSSETFIYMFIYVTFWYYETSWWRLKSWTSWCILGMNAKHIKIEIKL